MKLVYTKQALQDAKKIAASGFRHRAEQVLEVLRQDPYQTPPPYGKLVGDLTGIYFRRITIQHRLVYQVLDQIKTVKVLRMWASID